MSVRENRLWAEYDAMKKFRSQVVSWETPSDSLPSEAYHFTYRVKSIVGFRKDQPIFHTGFKVEVRFPRDFPRGKPSAYFVSKPYPYHPNIWWADGRIDFEISKHWIPGIGIGLDTICQEIGEIIAFQRFDLGSVCNNDPILIKWIKSHSFELPVDTATIRLPDVEDAIRLVEGGEGFEIGKETCREEEKLRNIVLVIEAVGKRIPITDIDGAVTAEKLLDTIADRVDIPAGTRGVLIRKSTRKQLSPDQSLASAGIEDGEILIVDFESAYSGVIKLSDSPRAVEKREKIKSITIMLESTGKRIPVEEVDGTVTAEELLDALVNKIGLPARTRGVLTRKLTRKQLLPNQSLARAGIEDGETLIADFERTAGGGYPLIGDEVQRQPKSKRKIRNITLVIEHTGKRIPVEEVDGTVTAEELLDALVNKIGLPARTRGVLTRKLTRKQLLPNQSLARAGIEDGETLIADFEHTTEICAVCRREVEPGDRSLDCPDCGATYHETCLRFVRNRCVVCSFLLSLTDELSLIRFSQLWNEAERFCYLNVYHCSPDFIRIASEIVEFMSEIIGCTKLNGRIDENVHKKACAFWIDGSPIFGGLKLRTTNLPIVFLQTDKINKDIVDDLLFLIKKLGKRFPSRIFLLVLFDRSDSLEHANRVLSRLTLAYSTDIITFGQREFENLIKSESPVSFFRSTILANISLEAVSPFVTTGPTSDEMFFGRERELKDIRDHVASTSFAPIGGRQIGKTSILKQLERVRLPAVGIRPFFHDCSLTPTQAELIQALAADRSWFPKCPADPPTSFADIIQRLSDDRPLVVLFDEADKLIVPDRADGYLLFNTLRALANMDRCHFVLSGGQALRAELANPNSPLYNFANAVLIGRLDFRAAKELVTHPMKQLEIELADETVIVQGIWDFTSGHPNVIQRLCQWLIVRLNQRQDRYLTLEDVKAVVADPNFLRKDFLNIYWERATSLERICSLVMAANDSMHTLTAIYEALISHGIEVTLNQVDDALERLVDLRNILQRTAEGYDFAVTAFPEIIAKTARLDDLIALNRETYQHHGDVEPRSKRGVS